MEDIRTIKLISDTGKEVEISEDSASFVLDQDGLDLGSVSGTHNMTQYIDLIGQHLDSTVLSPRDISIIGWVIGDSLSDINKNKTLLNKLVNPMFGIKLEIGDYALDFVPDSSVQYSTEWNYNNSYMCKFQIQGTAPMPLFRLKNYIDFRQTTEMTPKFMFPFAIPKDKGIIFASLAYESLKNMPNRGDVISGFTIYITIDEDYEGTVTNPIINNITTGKSIKLEFDMQSGDELEICTELGQQYVTLKRGGIVSNAIKYMTIESDIDMTLALGINTIELDADLNGDVLRGKVVFSPRFLEVQGR